MSRQNWLNLGPTCSSSYKSHTAEWNLKNRSLILLAGRAPPCSEQAWSRGQVVGSAETHLRCKYRAACGTNWEERLTCAQPLDTTTQWQVASDTRGFKEATQSFKWAESRDPSWRSWLAFATQRNAGGLWCFQVGEQWRKQPRIDAEVEEQILFNRGYTAVLSAAWSQCCKCRILGLI